MHSHGKHGHHHHGEPSGGHGHVPKSETGIAIAAVLTGAFMLAEIAGGLLSGSLALIADAGHMLTDFASLVLAWLAFRIARRPADRQRTYGFDRFSVLAAFVNGLSLFVIAGWIVWEALQRLRQPVEVLGGLMLWVALAGLAVNVVAFVVLTRGEAENLNVRAAALHVAGDLLGSVAAIVAALVIMATGWMPIDPILSVLVAVIILRSAWAVLRESAHILLEGTPRGLDMGAMRDALSAVSGVAGVSHIHAWSITQERPMVTLEVTPAAGADPFEVKMAVKKLLAEKFGIAHATVDTA
ncbi:MAG: cation transporter [Nitratireductor sp.]|nr:cation transporter [Nitratireductor sp.]